MFIPLTPVRCLHRAVDLYGDKIGVVSGDRQFTYSEFGDRCERLATALACLGIEPGDRIAYLSFNNHQLLEGYFGVLQARAVMMPLNVRLAPPELLAILNHSGARVLFFENEIAPLVEKLRPACASIERAVTLDDEKHPAADLTYEELLAGGRPERARIFALDENAPGELFYTSGSTGTPKGVVLSHRTLYLHALDLLSLGEYSDAEVELHTIPLFHANGWGRPQLATLMGTKQVMMRRFDPALVLRLAEQHRATQMSLVPTMANALLSAPNLRESDLASMKLIHIGGAASSPLLIEKMEQAFKCRVVAGYGLTETSPVVSTGRLKSGASGELADAERWRLQAMAGLPVAGVEVRVVDPQMRDVPRDMTAIGELVARGDHVMDGYYKDPEGTAAAMTDNWLHTGDMAVWDADTRIHIVDRKKEIIVSGGENISSIEIEKAILMHPGVYECAVVPAPDETWGEAPAAIVVRKPGASLSAGEVLAALEGRLAKFKMPRIVEVTDEPLPKTGTGKIRKLEIRERFWRGRQRRVQG